jgi:site-specific DNA-methyltransferase (adenine-specific)
MDKNIVYNDNCFNIMKTFPNKSIDFVLTDIPYDEVQRETNGLSNMKSLDTLGSADKATFELEDFLPEVYRICKNSVCIFCGREQFSEVFKYFSNKPGTTRPIVWQKTNPVPSNGQYVYLSGVEFAVWFKRKGAKTFNARCKNTVFNYPIPQGKKRIHQTQKHWDLFKELIEDNTNEGDLVFDPCAGGFTTILAAATCNRNFICCELDKKTYDKSKKWYLANQKELIEKNNIRFIDEEESEDFNGAV